MITTEDPSCNGIEAFGLFDLCGAMDLMPWLYAGMDFVQIAGKTKYKTFNRARNYAWQKHGEPLFTRLYKDKITGDWNYHVLFPFYRSNQYRNAPGAVVLNLKQVTAIVQGGRKYLDYLFDGGHIE